MHQQVTVNHVVFRALPGLLLVAAVIIVFAPVAGYEFLSWDDNLNIAKEDLLDRPAEEALRLFWSGPYFSFYIPVTRTLWLALARVTEVESALSPRPFHLTNLAVHCLNVLLVFGLLHRFTRRDESAFVGALLFALHPLQVEPVAWVTGLKDVLGAFFGLAALWFYLPAGGRSAPPRVEALRYAAASALFALGLLSKPGVVAVPLIAAVFDLWIVHRPVKAAAIGLLPWLLLALPVMVITASGEGEIHVTQVALWARPLIAADALAFYLGKLFVPAGLATDYGRRPALVLAQPWIHYTWVLPAVVAAAVFVLRRRLPWLASAALVMLAALLPILGFVPFAYQEYSTVADRYMYTAMLGPALATAFALRAVKSRWLLAGTICVGVLLGALSAIQVTYWQSDTATCRRILQVNPASWVAYTNLGTRLSASGRNDLALPLFVRAVQLRPDWDGGRCNLGVALRESGETEQAVAEFREAVRLAPDNAMYRGRLAEALGALGRTEEAIAEYETAIRIGPQDPISHLNLGVYLMSLGRPAEAIERLREAVRLDPQLVSARGNFAIALALAGHPAEAQTHFEYLLQQRPYDANLLYNYAVALTDMGRPEEAIELLQRALSIRGDFQPARDALERALKARDG